MSDYKPQSSWDFPKIHQCGKKKILQQNGCEDMKVQPKFVFQALVQ